MPLSDEPQDLPVVTKIPVAGPSRMQPNNGCRAINRREKSGGNPWLNYGRPYCRLSLVSARHIASSFTKTCEKEYAMGLTNSCRDLTNRAKVKKRCEHGIPVDGADKEKFFCKQTTGHQTEHHCIDRNT